MKTVKIRPFLLLIANKLLQAFLPTPFFAILGLMLLALLLGTAGYMLIEGRTLANALYMTLITVTTLGFGEVEPLSTTGRHITIF